MAILQLIGWSALVLSAGAGEVDQRAQRNANYSIERTPAHRYRATLTMTVTTPSVRPAEWIGFVAVPPSFAGQKVERFSVTPAGEEFADGGIPHRLLTRVRITPTRRESPPTATWTASYEITTFRRTLCRDAKMAGPIDLTKEERTRYLREAGDYDFSETSFQAWREENNLSQQDGESDIDYARRVFLFLKRTYQYEYVSKMDRRSSVVCRAKGSDCGGMASLMIAILRSQGIPGRLLVGRWAQSAKPGDRIGDIVYEQQHAKGEFFAEGVGWVPFDVSSAITLDPKPGGTKFFGRDEGNFITMHFDRDLAVDTIHFGKQSIPFLQGFAYWVRGKGTLDDARVVHDWRVEPIP